jgi:hypothetical protein
VQTKSGNHTLETVGLEKMFIKKMDAWSLYDIIFWIWSNITLV